MTRRTFLAASAALPGGRRRGQGSHGHPRRAARPSPGQAAGDVRQPQVRGRFVLRARSGHARSVRRKLAVDRAPRWVSMDALLGDPALDLIVFEGEVRDAIPWGTKVIEAGKHLHLEKPPTNKLKPFSGLVELARERGKKIQLGYMWRFHGGVQAALDAYRNGWLGEVFMIRATINSDRGPEQRAVEARYPGGSMFELGGHVIDRVVAFLGRPGKVTRWLRHDTSEPDALKDNTLAVLEYENALAVLVSSAKMGGSGGHRSFEVIGTDGTFFIQPMEPAPVMKVFMREARGSYRAGWQQIERSRAISAT